MFNPIINVTSTNPNSSVVDNSNVPEWVKQWFDVGLNPFKYSNGNIETNQLTTVINIPDAIQLAPQIASGAPVLKTGFSGSTIQLSQQHYAYHQAVDAMVYQGSQGLIEQINLQMDAAGTGDYAAALFESVAMNALVKNSVRPNVDGLGVFATNHPVNPLNPSQVARTTGSATQANLLTACALSEVNLNRAIIAAHTLCYPNGQPIVPKNMTLWVTPANKTLALNLTSAMFLGSQKLYSSSDTANVGSTINPYSKLGLEVEVLPRYPVNGSTGYSTDWYLTTGIAKPFITKMMKKPQIVKLMNPDDAPVYNHNEYVVAFQADFAIDVYHHLAIIKCTA